MKIRINYNRQLLPPAFCFGRPPPSGGRGGGAPSGGGSPPSRLRKISLDNDHFRAPALGAMDYPPQTRPPITFRDLPYSLPAWHSFPIHGEGVTFVKKNPDSDPFRTLLALPARLSCPCQMDVCIVCMCFVWLVFCISQNKKTGNGMDHWIMDP